MMLYCECSHCGWSGYTEDNCPTCQTDAYLIEAEDPEDEEMDIEDYESHGDN